MESLIPFYGLSEHFALMLNARGIESCTGTYAVA